MRFLGFFVATLVYATACSSSEVDVKNDTPDASPSSGASTSTGPHDAAAASDAAGQPGPVDAGVDANVPDADSPDATTTGTKCGSIVCGIGEHGCNCACKNASCTTGFVCPQNCQM